MSVVLRPTARSGAMSPNTKHGDTMHGDGAHRAWCLKDEHHIDVHHVSQADRLSLVRGELLRYCDRLTGSRQDAEDVAHETLLKALPYVEGTRVHPNLDPVPYEILEAYVSAFQADDMRALVQLCYDGTLDPVQAMTQGIPLATQQNVRSTPGESSIRDAMTHVLSVMAA